MRGVSKAKKFMNSGISERVNMQTQTEVWPKCPVPECTRRRRPEHVMCAAHWQRVGKRMQAEVYRECRRHPGSAAHLRAMAAAVQMATAVAAGRNA